MSENIKTYTDLPKILIVDDISANIIILKKVLTDLDAILIEASSGKEAIAASYQHNFALILMDVNMPGMDGFETARILKSSEKTHEIPIIFITANPKDEQLIRKGYKIGAVDFINKPFDTKNLISKVAVFLELDRRVKKLIAQKVYTESIIWNFLDLLLVVDKQAVIKTVSRSGCKLLGYHEKELIGLPASMLFDDKKKSSCFFQFYDPTKGIEGYHNKNAIFNYELSCRSKKGNHITLSFSAEILFDKNGNVSGITAGAKDITALKNVELQLKKEKKTSEGIIKTIQEGIIIVDAEGIIKFANDAIANMLGCQKEALIGEIFGFPVIEDEFTEIDILGKKGLGGIGEIRSAVIEWEDKKATLVTVLDITKLKSNEDKLRLLSSELQERNTDLNSYAHTVAHDLKLPVGNIQNFAELITTDYNKLSDEKIKEYLGYIFKTSNSLTNIITELLLFASLQKTEIATTGLEMKEIVEQAIQSLSHMKQQSRAVMVIPEKFHQSVGYAPWIEEVWKNYISNCLKYAGEQPRLEFGSDHQLNEVKYWIKDDGPGISKKNQSLLFGKFERLDNAHATGHGLGLSIVRRIIDKLGGRTGVESELGEGSTFYFTLPAIIITEHTPTTSSGGDLEKDHSFPSLKTLVVEDDMASAIFMGIVAKKFSNNILQANSGRAAIETCLENPDIDLILMDVGLPDINGYEATKKIRTFNTKVIIIAQTAFTLSNDKEKAFEAGCNEYISKPINVEELLNMIKNHLPRSA